MRGRQSLSLGVSRFDWQPPPVQGGLAPAAGSPAPTFPLAHQARPGMVRGVKADEIRKLVHARPFRPFVVYVADGGGLPVKHEDFVALAPSGREMIVYRHDQPDDYEVVNLRLVTRLQVSTRNGARKSRK